MRSKDTSAQVAEEKAMSVRFLSNIKRPVPATGGQKEDIFAHHAVLAQTAKNVPAVERNSK